MKAQKSVVEIEPQISTIRDEIHKHSKCPRLPLSLKQVPSGERDKIQISVRSVYGDNEWDLTEEFPDYRSKKVKLRFINMELLDGSHVTDSENRYLLEIAKEFYYSLIVDPVPSRPKWATCCYMYQNGIKWLFRFMHLNNFTRLSNLLEMDFEDFLSWVANEPHAYGGSLTNNTLRGRILGLSWLYDQRHKLSDSIQFWPFGEHATASDWAEYAAVENVPRNSRPTPEIPDDIAIKLVLAAIGDLKIGDQLERLENARIQYKPKRREVTCKQKDGTFRKKNIVANKFYWPEFGLLTGKQRSSHEARISAAVFILIAMFTGMRVHEVLNIKIGIDNYWRKQDIFVDGLRKEIYFVISKTTKLQAEATQYLWQTIPLIKEAINALERALCRRRTAGNQFLFASRINRKGPLDTSSINELLKKFVAHHKIFHHDTLWNISTHQFRKKFSRIMIRQGLGMIELQDQLKHFDVEMTRVYGDLNLYTELQEEKFSLSQEKYDELIRNNTPIFGGAAGEILLLRKEFRGMAKADRESFLKSLPHKALIEQMDDGLCMYRPDKALCGGNSSNCRPADCNNSILPIHDTARTLHWRQSENDRLLKFFFESPVKGAHLKRRNAEIDSLRSQILGTKASKNGAK